MVEEACRHIPELEIMIELLVGLRIDKLASGFHKEKEEATRVQLDLNLQITKLRVKVQSSTPLEVRE